MSKNDYADMWTQGESRQMNYYAMDMKAIVSLVQSKGTLASLKLFWFKV